MTEAFNLPELPEGLTWKIGEYEGFNGNRDYPQVGFGISLRRKVWWFQKYVGRSPVLYSYSYTIKEDLMRSANTLLSTYEAGVDSKVRSRATVEALSGIYGGKK